MRNIFQNNCVNFSQACVQYLNIVGTYYFNNGISNEFKILSDRNKHSSIFIYSCIIIFIHIKFIQFAITILATYCLMVIEDEAIKNRN